MSEAGSDERERQKQAWLAEQESYGEKYSGRPSPQKPDIYPLRERLAQRIAERDEAAWHLKRDEAQVLLDYIALNGGDPKALGPNEHMQKLRAVDVLDKSDAYFESRCQLRDAERAVRLAEAEIEAHIEAERRAHDDAAREVARYSVGIIP